MTLALITETMKSEMMLCYASASDRWRGCYGPAYQANGRCSIYAKQASQRTVSVHSKEASIALRSGVSPFLEIANLAVNPQRADTYLH